MKPSRGRRIRTSVLVLAALAGLMLGGPAAHTAAYEAPAHTFARPTAGHPDVYTWRGATLASPVNSGQIPGPSLSTTCDPTGTKLCEDIKLAVPAGIKASTLYVKVAWQHPVWKLYTYVIDPSGKTHGGGALGCDTDSYEKACGNETTLPFDEVTIPNPKPGTWTVRVAAVHIFSEAYTGTASLTASDPLQYLRENLAQLTSHLTRTQRVNVVFVGWQPTSNELADLRNNSTTQYQIPVAEKQFADCNDNLTGFAVAGLVQGVTCDYTGTDPATNGSGSTVPYFEPLKFNFDYRYFAASDSYAKDLFAQMKAATAIGQTFTTGRVPFTSVQAPFKEAYLTKYNAEFGQYRGTSHLVTDTTTVDMVDGIKVEDWVENSRFDAQYAHAFRDLVSGKTFGAQFLNPDPRATRDIHWDGNGKRAANVDKDPQGLNTGLTFYLLDTFSPSYADQYFRPDHYHTWSVLNDVKDPDTGEASGPDNGRGWGGRYRFYMLDLGAAPSEYERSDWVSANVNPEDGSAWFDPPIWQWRNDPQWNGTSPVKGSSLTVVQKGVDVQVPYHFAGDTLGTVLGYEITTGLAYKFVGAYLYRPIPNDVYIINTLQVVDHYSLPPQQGGQDLYSVDLSKVYQPALGVAALSAAAPYAYFSPNFVKYITLGCAKYRFVLEVKRLVADPTCTNPDGLQQAVEDGKANGLGYVESVPGFNIPDYAVNVNPIRDYVDAHRDIYAPLVEGAFSVPVFNIMFEKQFNAALPLLVGGIALSVNGGEGWGQLDNVNDDLIPARAVDCTQSAPGACESLAANPQHHDYFLTYVVTHEAAHFLGLNHPHDGAEIPTKASNGTWTKYYDGLKWLYDITGSPTTYAAPYSQYENIDQDRLMYGHTAEYLKQAQDWISDAYFQDGAAGLTVPSTGTTTRLGAMKQYRDTSSALFQLGDYLHAQYAMKDAALYAQGNFQTQMAPHKVSTDQAARNSGVVFSVHPDLLFNPDAPAGSRPSAPVRAPAAPVRPASTHVLAVHATTTLPATGVTDGGVFVATLLIAGAAVVRRFLMDDRDQVV